MSFLDYFLPKQKSIAKEVVTDDEIRIIRNTYHSTLADWYDQLNTWKWPYSLLPEELPKDRAKGRRTRLMELISNKVGEKYLLRCHNKSRMSEEEFEDFWQGTRNKDTEAYNRYMSRLQDRCNKDTNDNN